MDQFVVLLYLINQTPVPLNFLFLDFWYLWDGTCLMSTTPRFSHAFSHFEGTDWFVGWLVVGWVNFWGMESSVFVLSFEDGVDLVSSALSDFVESAANFEVIIGNGDELGSEVLEVQIRYVFLFHRRLLKWNVYRESRTFVMTYIRCLNHPSNIHQYLINRKLLQIKVGGSFWSKIGTVLK